MMSKRWVPGEGGGRVACRDVCWFILSPCAVYILPLHHGTEIETAEQK